MSDPAVIVDSGPWIDYLRGGNGGASLRELLDEGRAVLILPVLLEVLQGVRDPTHLPRLRRAFRSATWLEVTRDEVLEAAELRAAVADGPATAAKSRRTPPSITDAAIVAVANRRELWVWTNDLVDLARVASSSGLGLRAFDGGSA